MTDGLAHSHVPIVLKRSIWQYAKQRRLKGIVDRERGSTTGQFFSLLAEVERDLGVKLPMGEVAQRGTYAAALADNAVDWLRDGLGQLQGTIWSADEASIFWQTRWRDMRYPKKADEIAEYNPQQYTLRKVMDALQSEMRRPPDRGTLANEGRQCEPDPAAPDIAQDVT